MSFFPTKATTPSGLSSYLPDDPHLQVTVTPSASAFFAGETFSVKITFTNTRLAYHPLPTPTTAPSTAQVVSAVRPTPTLSDRQARVPTLPKRCRRIGRDIVTLQEDENAEAGPSRTPVTLGNGQVPSPSHAQYPYSPGADPTYRAPGWPSRETTPVLRGPEQWRSRELGRDPSGRVPPGHSRRAKSLAMGRDITPQEMVWALGGDPSQSATPSPPPLPSRRATENGIPSQHPHSRKLSIISPPMPSAPLPRATEHNFIPEEPHTPYTAPKLSQDRHYDVSPSSSQSQVDLTDTARASTDQSRPMLQRAPNSQRHSYVREPSYQNAHGASLLGAFGPPPPIHPDIRKQDAVRTTNVLWAYTRLVARFHPSNTYIPPDPLLPLRAMLLHQPVGSGSLLGNEAAHSSSSRWQLSFGTGTIGNETQPTLTGSLFGLAKSLVSGGTGGTLEEERKRVWNMKDLPVLETARSLLGVDLKLKECETQSFTYSFQLPQVLPPTFRGKAFRFAYDLIVSVNVALPGRGNKQRAKEVTVPIRVWSHVSMSNPSPTYDVLTPIIQNKDNGIVVQDMDIPADETNGAEPKDGEKAIKPAVSGVKLEKTKEALRAYASELLKQPGSSKSHELVDSEDLLLTSPAPDVGTVDLDKSITEPLVSTLEPAISVAEHSNGITRPRNGSFVEADDGTGEGMGMGGGCGEAVEVLSRHSPKRSYDIEEDGDPVAVFHLIKTTYRLGESILGVLDFNGPENERRVLKSAAYLESHEIIPENLLSDPTTSARPKLNRLHAEHSAGYTLHTSRLSFSLDIPSDATPEFSISAGPEGAKGGVEWKIRLVFLVSVPSHRHALTRKSFDHRKLPSSRKERGESMVELRIEQGRENKKPKAAADNALYTAARSLAPVVVDEEGEWAGKTEVMVVEIPVRVLAGNTAFLVKPTVCDF